MTHDRPRILGILNVTPDSFSDGGAHGSVESAVEHGLQLHRQGADGVDVGGESTRPGAKRVDAAEQIRRVLPVIEGLAGRVGLLSVDTTRAEVAEAALNAGANMINDVSAGRDDERMLALAGRRGCLIVLMHMLGEPATMQLDPRYGDVAAEVEAFLLERAEAAMRAGVRREAIVLDPGIGFGKTTEHNLRLLARLPGLVARGFAVMLGTSRKRFLGEICCLEQPMDRDAATAATTALGAAAGVAWFRVHDVALNRIAADAAWRVRQAGVAPA
jgi:dihydropteroate synthase